MPAGRTVVSDSLPLSVVIPTYQRASSLERLLRALSRQTLRPSLFEVVVSVDGSTDDTMAMLERISVPFALRSLWRTNRGRAAACNEGIAEAKGGLIVLLDDDMEPLPNLLDAHMQRHLESPGVAVVGAAPVQTNPGASPAQQYIAERFDNHLKKLSEPGYQLKLRDFYSGNFSIERDLLRGLGGFDDSFDTYGNEDLELFHRLRGAGVRVVFDPLAQARQHYEKNFKELARDNLAKGRTAVRLAQKHPAVLSELRLSGYGQGSRKWRSIRRILLTASRVLPSTTRWVIAGAEWLGRYRPARRHRYFTLALDFCFWAGAEAATRGTRVAET